MNIVVMIQYVIKIYRVSSIRHLGLTFVINNIVMFMHVHYTYQLLQTTSIYIFVQTMRIIYISFFQAIVGLKESCYPKKYIYILVYIYISLEHDRRIDGGSTRTYTNHTYIQQIIAHVYIYIYYDNIMKKKLCPTVYTHTK